MNDEVERAVMIKWETVEITNLNICVIYVNI